MKNWAYYLLLLLTVNSCSDHIEKVQATKESTELKNLKQVLNNRNDSTTWDLAMFEMDKLFIEAGDFGPMSLGAFPVPKYELLGKDSFKGIGNNGEVVTLHGKKIVVNSFFVNRSQLNAAELKDRKDDVFFHILILTDTLDEVNDKLAQSIVVSRNHPDYIGQGFVQTKNNRIDYLSFLASERGAYAIVNTRLFDLKEGKTILLAPQKDKSLRSLQLQTPVKSSAEIVNYTRELLKQDQVVNFFLNRANI